MKNKENRALHKAKKRRFLVLIQLFIYLLLLLPVTTMSTYTWFSISKTPSVNDMQINVGADNGILLAWERNAEEWLPTLNYEDAVTAETALRPSTYSYEEDAYYAVQYDRSGRVQSTDVKLSEEKNANRIDDQAYLVKFTFYAKAGADVGIFLADSNNGRGTFLCSALEWDSENFVNYNQTTGAELAMRIGLRISLYETEDESELKESAFAIYEPNADKHIDGSSGYVETLTPNGQPLAPLSAIYTQSATTWEEKFPVKKGEVDYDFGTYFGEEKQPIIVMEANTIAKVEVIVWLEGQDIDCTNQIGTSSKILAQIAFETTRLKDPDIVD